VAEDVWKWHIIPYPCGWNTKDWSLRELVDLLEDRHAARQTPVRDRAADVGRALHAASQRHRSHRFWRSRPSRFSSSGNGATAIPVGPQERPLPARAATAFAWSPRSGARYEIDITRAIMTGASQDAPVPPTVHISGVLNMRVLSTDAGSVLAGLRLSPISCELFGEFRPEMRDRFSLPFSALFGKNGTIESVSLSPTLSENERTILGEALRSMQIVVSGDAAAWTTKEEHATGPYEARYERASDGAIRKRKTR
jgi:hypothetical protein